MAKKISIRSIFLLYLFIHFHRIDSHDNFLIFWNRTTFMSSQNSSLFLQVRLGDVMDLICPYYDHDDSTLIQFEQYEIYRVTSKEYDQCHFEPFHFHSITRSVINCNTPLDLMKYTLNFRSYLPVPNGFEFRSNETYYFLSTSINDRTQCFRLKIYVQDHHRPSISSGTTSIHTYLFSQSVHDVSSSTRSQEIDRSVSSSIKDQRAKPTLHSSIDNSPFEFQDSKSTPMNMFTFTSNSSSLSNRHSTAIVLLISLLCFLH